MPNDYVIPVLKQIRDNLHENNRQLKRIADIMEADYVRQTPVTTHDDPKLNEYFEDHLRGLKEYAASQNQNHTFKEESK